MRVGRRATRQLEHEEVPLGENCFDREAINYMINALTLVLFLIFLWLHVVEFTENYSDLVFDSYSSSTQFAVDPVINFGVCAQYGHWGLSSSFVPVMFLCNSWLIKASMLAW